MNNILDLISPEENVSPKHSLIAFFSMTSELPEAGKEPWQGSK